MNRAIDVVFDRSSGGSSLRERNVAADGSPAAGPADQALHEFMRIRCCAGFRAEEATSYATACSIIRNCRVPADIVRFCPVSCDYRTAGRVATEHLLALGHRRMGFYGGAEPAFEPYVDRLAGCMDAIQEAPGAQLIELKGERVPDASELHAAIAQYRLSALMFGDLGQLITGLECMHALDRRVPEDISVLALGDSDRPVSLPAGRQPTSVAMDRVLVGETAVRMLIARLDGTADAAAQQRLVPCTFHPGNTTGPAA